MSYFPYLYSHTLIDTDNDVSTTVKKVYDVTEGGLTLSGNAVDAEHGAGIIGTGVAPATFRYTLGNGDIVTEIQLDLTGLAVKGDATGDVIGLAGTDSAPSYIGQYVTATCGIVYRVEVLCLETPGEGTATITTDIDIAGNADGTLEYDEAAGSAECDLGGLAAGNSYVIDAPGLTADDYLYLVEGDTTAATGEYDAGQLIVRLYGHSTLS